MIHPGRALAKAAGYGPRGAGYRRRSRDRVLPVVRPSAVYWYSRHYGHRVQAQDATKKRQAKAVAYGALELATARRGVPRTIDGQPIRFPARWSRYYPRTYDPRKTQFLLQHCRSGDTVVDLGAHIGLYTVLMSRAVGPSGNVIALEPAPDTFRVLGTADYLSQQARKCDSA